MKKSCCILMAIAMLCSLMVANASAANTYEGEGFKIVTDYSGYIEGGMDSDNIYAYDFYCYDFSDEARIQIFVLKGNSAEEAEQAFYGEYYSCGEDIILNGTPAIINEESDDYFCNYYTYSGNYIFEIEVEAIDDQSYDILKYIVEADLFFDDYSYESDDNYYEDNYYEDDYYEDDYYEENYDSESSTYWENDSFTIDTNVKLTLSSEAEEGENYSEYYYDLIADNNEWLGGIEVVVQRGDDVSELYDEFLGYMNEGCVNVQEVQIGGLTGTQGDENIEDYLGRFTIILDNDTFYYIAIEGTTENRHSFDTLCDVVNSDFRFKNTTKDNDKADKDSDEISDDDSAKNNSIIIIVAIVVAGVVVIAVVAIVVLGKKKKQ